MVLSTLTRATVGFSLLGYRSERRIWGCHPGLSQVRPLTAEWRGSWKIPSATQVLHLAGRRGFPFLCHIWCNFVNHLPPVGLGVVPFGVFRGRCCRRHRNAPAADSTAVLSVLPDPVFSSNYKER